MRKSYLTPDIQVNIVTTSGGFLSASKIDPICADVTLFEDEGEAIYDAGDIFTGK